MDYENTRKIVTTSIVAVPSLRLLLLPRIQQDCSNSRLRRSLPLKVSSGFYRRLCDSLTFDLHCRRPSNTLGCLPNISTHPVDMEASTRTNKKRPYTTIPKTFSAMSLFRLCMWMLGSGNVCIFRSANFGIPFAPGSHTTLRRFSYFFPASFVQVFVNWRNQEFCDRVPIVVPTGQIKNKKTWVEYFGY